MVVIGPMSRYHAKTDNNLTDNTTDSDAGLCGLSIDNIAFRIYGHHTVDHQTRLSVSTYRADVATP
jgi:hypothetical protein